MRVRALRLLAQRSIPGSRLARLDTVGVAMRMDYYLLVPAGTTLGAPGPGLGSAGANLGASGT